MVLTGVTAYYVRRLKVKNQAEQERLRIENHLLSLEQKASATTDEPSFYFQCAERYQGHGGRQSGKHERADQ